MPSIPGSSSHGVPAPRRAAIIAVSALIAVAAACAGIMLGSTMVSLPDLLAVLTGDEPVNASAKTIVTFVRAPRVLAALLAGAALALAGCIIQTVLDNPLASPNVIGVNSGAGFAVLLASALVPGAVGILPAAAFAGALLTCLLVFCVSMKAGASRLTIVLIGMAATTIFGAGMNVILIVKPDAYIGASSFLVGGLAGVRLTDLVAPAILIAIAMVAAYLNAPRLTVMLAGDDVARGVGMNVMAARLGMLVVAALLAGSAVSFAGMLGFVGLIVPHVVRLLVGSHMPSFLVVSSLLGGAFVTLCDLAARCMFAPYELPVGILMALLGGPFFIWLVLRAKGGIDG